MLESKLAETIKVLTPAEKAEFASFLDSRFFQREFSIQQLKQFLSLFTDALAEPDKNDLSKEDAHKVLFPDKPFAENRIDRIMYELNRLAKTFLLVKHYLEEENELQQTLDWSAIQRNRGLDANFEKQFQKVREELLNEQKSSADAYLKNYLAAKEEHEWYSRFNKGKGDLNIPQAIEALDTFFFTQKLEFLNRLLVQQKLSSLKIAQTLELSEGSLFIPDHYLNSKPSLLISYKIYQLLKVPQPSIEGYQELLELLKANEKYFKPEILSQFYTYFRNICIILIDAGYVEYNPMLHELYKDNLKRGYFYFEGKISPNAYLAITQQAILTNNIEWASSFVESHKNLIIGENDTYDFYKMNKAFCLFGEKKYDEALSTIPFGSTYANYHLMARRLELKIYYETQSELLPSKIDAFKMFINRSGNKNYSKTIAELYTNFGNFVHQLSLSIPGDKKRSELLVRRIQEKKHVGERSWLLAKARELGESKL